MQLVAVANARTGSTWLMCVCMCVWQEESSDRMLTWVNAINEVAARSGGAKIVHIDALGQLHRGAGIATSPRVPNASTAQPQANGTAPGVVLREVSAGAGDGGLKGALRPSRGDSDISDTDSSLSGDYDGTVACDTAGVPSRCLMPALCVCVCVCVCCCCCCCCCCCL